MNRPLLDVSVTKYPSCSAGDLAMGARNEHVGVVDLPVRFRAAADHQFTLVQPGLRVPPGCVVLARASEASSCRDPRHFRPPSDDRPQAHIFSIAPFSRAVQATRFGRAVRFRSGPAARASLAQHDPQIDVEQFADKVANRAFQHVQPLAAGQECHEILIAERADAKLDPALPAEGARSDRGAAAKRAHSSLPSRLCRALSERSSRWRRTPLAGPAP